MIGASVAAGVLAVAVAIGTCSDGDERPDDPQAFCERMEAFREAVDRLGQGPESTEQVASAREAAAAVAERARGLAESAPEAVAGDVEVMAETTVEVAERLRAFYAEIEEDPSKAQDAAYLASFDFADDERARLETAARRVRPYVSERCGIELEEPAPDPSASTTPSAPPPPADE